MREITLGRAVCVGLFVLGLSVANDFVLASSNTVLMVDKSGDDVLLSWTGTGASYDGARATHAPFTNATTQFLGIGGTSHAYPGAVGNSESLEFFDVTDETESNRGGNWNGGVLPPLPPVIDAGDPGTNIGNLYIGSLGLINGSGFSTIPRENIVCFKGGVCTTALSATPTSIAFQTPPGAYSGGMSVTVRAQRSERKGASVALDDPAEWSAVAALTYSEQDQSYWILGGGSGGFSVYRLFFDTGTQEWTATDFGLGATSDPCSSHTSRNGQIFCEGGAVPSEGEIDVTVINTSPPTAPAHCVTIDLEASPLPTFVSMPSAAMDPNPAGLRADAGYVTVAEVDTGITLYRILKVASNCSSILDGNYGNFATDEGARNNSMVVDPTNGDLYSANDGEIRRITTSESVTVVRSGLPASTRVASLSREGADDPGTLLLNADGVIEALALDNMAADPRTLGSVGNVFFPARFGAQVSGGPWDTENVNRTVAVYWSGSSLILQDHPLIDVTFDGPFDVRISSPSTTEDLPVGQSSVRSSDPSDISHSYAVTKLEYRDGLARTTCAMVGDPGPGAPQYDPIPPAPSECNKPRAELPASCPPDSTPNCCDNVDAIVAGGPGSFAGGGGLVSCKTCGSLQDPCSWEFRITNRYAGDNYKVYFAFDQAAARFAATSDLYTAWKHMHIERERMCNVGAVLFEDYGATGQCGGAGQPACCGTGGQPPCNQILVYDFSNIANGQAVVVFDELNPYETAGYTRTVTAPPVNNSNGSVTLTLDNPLPKSYWASDEFLPNVPPHVPDFVNRHSGGVCVPSSGFVEADLSDLRQAFDPACVDYHVPTYGLDGAGVVPRLPASFFDLTARPCSARRFSQIWHSQFIDVGTIVGCPDQQADAAEENNIVQVIPAFDTIEVFPPAGFSAFEGAFTYVFDDQIAQDCAMSSGGCVGDEQDSMRRWTVAHETGHHFIVNKCSGTGGHDTRDAWCGSAGGACVMSPASDQKCVMNAGTMTPDLDMRADGTDHLCREDLALGDPTCGGTPREGAIRTLEDPQ